MSSEFDPYYTWLAIPPKDQPPNHYRLLGIETFETNIQVIDAAANRQLSYLQEMASGAHRKHAQQILNEVAGARRCLLDADRKAKYDKKLEAELEEAKPATAVVATAESPPAAAKPEATSKTKTKDQKPAKGGDEADEKPASKYTSRRRTSSGTVWIVGGLTGAVLLWIMISVVTGEKEFWDGIPDGFPPTCEQAAQTWRYTTKKPAGEWSVGLYDDTGWGEGQGPIGSEGTDGVKTDWKTTSIWMRRKFRLDEVKFTELYLRYRISGGSIIFLNGKQIAKLAGTENYIDQDLAKFKAYFNPGTNTLSAYVKTSKTDRYIDIGITTVSSSVDEPEDEPLDEPEIDEKPPETKTAAKKTAAKKKTGK